MFPFSSRSTPGIFFVPFSLGPTPDKNNKLPNGIAIDDGVAVVFIDGKPTEVYSSRKNHRAYFIDKHKKINLKDYIKNI